MDEWIGGRSENILISPFLILRTLHVTGFLCHLSSRTRAVLEVASLIWSVDRAQGCDRNHHNIQRRAHAQTLLVPVAVTCCASHGWAGISGRGACVLLGRRRRSVSVALAAPACGQHVPVPCPRSTSSSARLVPVVWTHGHASALACMHHACRSSC